MVEFKDTRRHSVNQSGKKLLRLVHFAEKLEETRRVGMVRFLL